jgi:sn-glycerol 3-phosphate transport system substrate-binding protein
VGRGRAWPRLIGVLAVATLLAACGGSGDDGASSRRGSLPECPVDALEQADGPVEVVLWDSLQARQQSTLEELAAEYNASQGRVRVRVENQGVNDAELLRKFTAAVPSRDLPAIFMGNDSMTQVMVDSGVVLPGQSCVDATDADLSAFSDTVLEALTVDDVLWPAMATPSSMLLYYNKDHFRQAGLDPDDPPGTLAEVRAAAEAIKAAGLVAQPFVHELAPTKIEYWLTGAGATIVDNDNGRSAPATQATLTDNDAALELYRWFDEMNRDGLLQAIPASEGRVDQYLAMANGLASMVVEPSGAATSIEAFLGGTLDPGDVGGVTPTDTSGLDLGAGEFPGLEAPGRTQVGGPVWYITSTTPPEVQAGAWDFVQFMLGEGPQLRELTGGSFLPLRTSVASSPEAQEFFSSSLAGGWLEIANGQLDDIDPDFPGPLIGPYDTTKIALSDSLTSVVLDGVSPEDALARAQAEIDEALQAYAAGGF